MKRLIATIALAAGMLIALPLGTISTAHASPATSISRAQAVRSATEYLQSQAFSRKGLTEQLKFEGFSTIDANYGASHSSGNWMKQAVRAAKEYLRSQAFSRQSLVEQLEFEGFTHSQALHGARGVGL